MTLSWSETRFTTVLQFRLKERKVILVVSTLCCDTLQIAVFNEFACHKEILACVKMICTQFKELNFQISIYFTLEPILHRVCVCVCVFIKMKGSENRMN